VVKPGGLHFPGSVYTGPGTPIVNRILSGVRPKTEIDKIALQHDIDYLRAQNEDEMLQADTIAIATARNQPFTLEREAMIYGLNFRKQLAKIGINLVKPGKQPILADYLESIVYKKHPNSFNVGVGGSSGYW